MNIALIGYGNVGKAFVELLKEKKEYLNKLGLNINIKYILRKSVGAHFETEIDTNNINWDSNVDFNYLMKQKDIDMLVELSPSNIKTAEPATTYIKKAMENGINVVTGNKAPILLMYNELLELAKKNKVAFGIGCTTGGALPALNLGNFDLAGAKITKIEAILNGTTNYILGEMQKGNSYENALEIAQQEGIAETNPSNDVLGYDTATKILILANVLLGQNKKLSDIDISGITNIKIDDTLKDKKVKLLGKAEILENNDVEISVKCEEIEESHPLYHIDGKNKGIVFTTDIFGELSVSGGASSPLGAAAAILRDIINLSRN